MWIPSRTRITGNEEAALLANQAILSLESTEIKSLSYKDLLRIGNKIALQQWQSQWNYIINNKLKNIKRTIKKMATSH